MLLYKEAKEIEELISAIEISAQLQFNNYAKAIEGATISEKQENTEAKLFLEKIKKFGKKAVILTPLLASANSRFRVSILIILERREKTAYSIRKAIYPIYRSRLTAGNIYSLLVTIETAEYIEQHGTTDIQLDTLKIRARRYAITEKGKEVLNLLERAYRAYKNDLEKIEKK